MRLIDYDEAYAKAHDLVHRGKLEWEEFSVIINFLDSMQIIDAEAVPRWIPVSERLPDTVKFEKTGTEYSEAVNVLTSGRKVLTAIFDGDGFIADAEFWEAEKEVITHWTPVLLPLPDAPMEDSNV